MSNLSLSPAHTHPHVDVWGNRQRFSFHQHESSFEMHNDFAPRLNIPTRTSLEWSNLGWNGFRLQHTTESGENIGSLNLYSFVNAEHDGTLLMDATPSQITFHVSTQGNEPQIPSEFSTKNYVDTEIDAIPRTIQFTGDVTGSGVLGTPFQATIPNTGITPGQYNWPNSFTVNAKGQVIGASSGGQPYTSLIAGTGISISSGGGSAQINITNTSVTSGSYAWPSAFSVNQQGQLTSVTSSGNFPINRLQNYPSNSSVFLRGDGAWATPSTPIIDINNGTTGQLPASRILNYPFNSNVFLNGSGGWSAPFLTLTVPYTINTSDLNTWFTIQNSNQSSYGSAFIAQNSNGNNVQFGFNNSTNEGYLWSSTYSNIKFGTNNTKWMEITGDGFVRHYGTAHFYKAQGGAPFNGNIWIKPYDSYLTGLNTSARRNANGWSTLIDVGNTVDGGCAISLGGNFIQLINNFNDLGVIFTDSDMGGAWYNWQSYISSSGNLIVSSSEQKKYSLRAKQKKNYLERINNLNVYSYALKCPVEEKDEKTHKDRKYFKNKQLHIGLVSEQVKELFENCTDTYKTINIDDHNKEDFESMVKGHRPSTCEEDFMREKNNTKDIYGINYNALLCYTILSIQELSEKVLILENTLNQRRN